MAENKFVPGFRVFAPRANAPTWVKADILIDVRELRDWLAADPHTEVRLQIKESRDGGKLYATVNDYQSGQGSAPPPPPPPPPPPYKEMTTPPPPYKEMTTNKAYNRPPPTPVDDLSDETIDDIPF